MAQRDLIISLVEKRLNNPDKLTDKELEILQADGYFFHTYWGVCDILKNGIRVGKAFKGKNDKYTIKWF